MADVKISQLPTALNPQTSDVVPIVSGGVTSKVSLQAIGTTIFPGGITPVLQGGTGASTASGARLNLGVLSMGTQSAASVNITGGAINGTSLGATTPAAGSFTSLSSTGVTNMTPADANIELRPTGTGTVVIAPASTIGTIERVNIGQTTNVNANFATCNIVSGTVASTPFGANDIVSKQYADGLAQGLQSKTTARLLANTNQTFASGLPIIDGVQVANGDFILCINQDNKAQNGVYIASNFGAWVRSPSLDTWNEFIGSFVFVQEGTLYADTGWVCTANAGGTLGVTTINYSQFSGAGSYTAGAGLTLTGTQFSVTDTAVVTGLYGSPSQIPEININSRGQIVSASNKPVSITTANITNAGTMATQNASNVAITGGTLQNTYIGTVTPVTGAFTTATAQNQLNVGTGTNNILSVTPGATTANPVQFSDTGVGGFLFTDCVDRTARVMQARANEQSLLNATDTVINWNTVDNNNTGLTQASGVWINQSGRTIVVTISYQVSFQASAAGQRVAYMTQGTPSGTTRFGQIQSTAVSGDSTTLCGTATLSLAPNETFRVLAYQTSGTTLTTGGGYGGMSSGFSTRLQVAVIS